MHLRNLLAVPLLALTCAAQGVPPTSPSLASAPHLQLNRTKEPGVDLATLRPAAATATSASVLSGVPAEPPQTGRNALGTVHTTVTVNAGEHTLETGLAVPYHITRSQVLSAAGTWGDFTRYLQLVPGVVWNTDMSNDVLVRGGDPSENLYVVDGIEVPNINAIALEGTTGGFTSMIDTTAIQSVDLQAGSYDSRFDSRLSSLVSIRTRRGGTRRSGEMDLGISGGGGLLQYPLSRGGGRGSLLLSAHRSVLNLVTNDIGMNGVPIYTNGLAQMTLTPGDRDTINLLSLDGADTFDVTPDPCDGGATLNLQTQYGGDRSTEGLVWKHVLGPTAFSSLTASYSFQGQNIGQQLQSTHFYGKRGCKDLPISTSPLYQENTRDRIGTLAYSFQKAWRTWLVSVGASGRTATLNYAVAQPVGQQSPFNPDPTWTDADSFRRDFTTGQIAGYAQATATLYSRWTFIAGAREESFAINASHAFEPRVSLAFRVNQHQGLNVAWSRSAQLPPYMDLLSYPANSALPLIRVDQLSAGGDLWRGHWLTASIETYTKHYSHEPVSTEYSSLMLANMVDTFGQQFVWLPLAATGFGRSSGVELQMDTHAGGRLRFMGSASYSRTRYAAADGVLRPGNFDFPLVGNGLLSLRVLKGFALSLRDTYATGRPYTPFNIKLSEAQSRGIYDLGRINSLRGPAYNRVDADLNRDFHLGRGILNVHGGVENALNRSNFLGFAWMDNCHPGPKTTRCGLNNLTYRGIPEFELTQMPVFPSGAVRFSF